jgi:glycosyltransferase involved in cell wall biosynthesis
MTGKRMNVLILSDYFYPHWTGIAKSFYYLIKSLDKKISFTVLTVRYDQELLKEEILFQTRIIREDSQFSLSRSKYSFSIIFRLLLIIRKYDVIFINSPSANILPFSLISKLFRKKLIIFHQGDLILPRGISNRIIELVYSVSTYIAFFLSDKVSTYTDDYARNSELLRHFLQKCIPFVFPVAAVNRVTKKHNNDTIIIGFAGRFVEEKGFDLLLEAIPGIVRQFPQVHFVYAGKFDMGYERFFEKNKQKYEKVKKHITVMGLLDETEMISYYRSLDFIIVPSRSDCFNLVQAEAMKSGVPSLAANIPGLRFLVQETGFGMLFEKEDPLSIEKTVITAIRHRSMFSKKYTSVLKILDDEKNTALIKDFITLYT